MGLDRGVTSSILQWALWSSTGLQDISKSTSEIVMDLMGDMDKDITCRQRKNMERLLELANSLRSLVGMRAISTFLSSGEEFRTSPKRKLIRPFFDIFDQLAKKHKNISKIELLTGSIIL